MPSEVCRERSIQKRAKLVKKFIKVARHCRDFHNFNSMFAIMSGLDKPAVRRLHHTWERVPKLVQCIKLSFNVSSDKLSSLQWH